MSIRYLFAFLIVWIAGVALADHVLNIETNAWSMAWGHAVAALATFVGNAAADQST